MKKGKMVLFAAAAGILCLAGCVNKPATVQVDDCLAGLRNPSIRILADHSRGVPVSGTFGWGYSFFRVAQIPDLNLGLINDRLHSALHSGLTGKGLVFEESEPDILVSYALANEAEIDDEELDRAYGGFLIPRPEVEETDIHYKRGVLVVDLVDRKMKHLLWRGAIMAGIDMDWPEERKQERCDAAIRELLRYCPQP